CSSGARSCSRSDLRSLGLAREEAADRVPDRLRAREREMAGGRMLGRQVLEQGRRLRRQRDLPRRGGLDVAHVARERAEPVELDLRGLAVVPEVRTVRRVEHVDVEAARVVALLDDLAHLAERGRRDGPAGARDLEEVFLRELPSLDGVRDEDGLEVRVLPAQALDGPEEERLCEPAVPLGHAGRDVHGEEDDRLGRRALTDDELAVAEIVVRERRPVALDRAPLDRLLHRAATVEARPHAAAVPTLPRVVLLAHRAALHRQVRQLQLLPEPIDDVVYLELEHELVAAVLVAAFALAVALAVPRRRELVAGLRVALADTGALPLVAQPEARMLEEPDRHLNGAVAAREDVDLRDQVRQLLADRVSHLVVVTQPVTRAAREQVVPVTVCTRAFDESRRTAGHIALRPCARGTYSCDNNVVT